MKIAILSDIHGNLSALEAVLSKTEQEDLDGYVILGDIIDYGMHSNEVINLLYSISDKIIVNIYGNHESSIINENYNKFSSERGSNCARYTREVLSETSIKYLLNNMECCGKKSIQIEGRAILCIHGSLEDPLWGTLDVNSVKDSYFEYDYVLSGHSHIPHYFEYYYAVDNVVMRNKKKCIFINPGSVGQPRNHNNLAQYCTLDTLTEEIALKKVKYDISEEMDAFDGSVDNFYKERLRLGI